ncbi:hypothetical protein [Altibacter sp. HG106]|uniref:hypothetical protein n=1 Tax=Altibacter sp. HG106 TaxID=3023937 RepID=UPI002350BC04|nr:hypothetical protein [Altibacter sp. HG106]MDC7994479.1 hypothetical protein [Altibacter sp. HG106]
MSNQEKYYRNKSDIKSIEGIEVDSGSLWRWDSKLKVLVLEDEDQHVTAYRSDEFDLD